MEASGNRAPLSMIFLDIDDTLYSTTEFAETARRNAVEAMVRAGLRADPREVLQELREIISEFSSNYDRHFNQLLKRRPSREYVGCNPAVIIAAGVVAYHQTKDALLTPYPDVIENLQRMRAQGFEFGVITSGLEIKQAEKLVRLGVLPCLDHEAIFISEQIGIDKPNPKLYARACRDLGIEPAQAMLVGDHPIKDVDAPRRLGMLTVRTRRGSRHASSEGELPAHYEIADFAELAEVIFRDFRPVGRSRGALRSFS